MAQQEVNRRGAAAEKVSDKAVVEAKPPAGKPKAVKRPARPCAEWKDMPAAKRPAAGPIIPADEKGKGGYVCGMRRVKPQEPGGVN